jgi:hypothetical protein
VRETKNKKTKKKRRKRWYLLYGESERVMGRADEERKELSQQRKRMLF